MPSVVDVVRKYVPDLTILNSQQLPAWQPTLPTPPPGWVLGRIDTDPAPTRIALHRNVADPNWDGCEVVNLFEFTGSLPLEVVPANAACTLHAVGADDIATRPLFVPPDLDATAALASGEFAMGGKRVWAQYTAYLAQEPADAATRGRGHRHRGMLLEHNTFITVDSVPKLHREIVQMGYDIQQTLISALSQR